MAVRLERRIDIAAPAERIWAQIADIAAWSAWNPLYAKASGKLEPGEVLDLAVAIPGMKPQPVRPTVTEVTPNRRLKYRSRGMGGLTRGDRYVEIVETAPGHCTVINGELMGGLAGNLIAPLLGKRVEQALAEMNQALKERAEA